MSEAEQNAMQFDVVIVGAGPAGLAAAIKLKQLDPNRSVCIVEKGSEVGAHILSGAVIEPRALDELIPNWKELDIPLHTPVTKDQFLLLSEKSGLRLPTPPQMKNHGNYIASLGNVCRWLANHAQGLGVEIYPGFAAADVIVENDKVVGVKTGDMGIAKDGNKKDGFQPGVELRATYTLMAEGCRGSISERLFERFDLRSDCDPQSYAIGVKEVWEIDPSLHHAGRVIHTVGWPLDNYTYGGSFIYHMENNQISLGLVIGLDYKNPYLDPYQELQRLKTHPKIVPLFKGARRIAYGARALNEGGFQSIPKSIFPGGAIIGCSAGYMNVPKIKGSHTAMKSGMLAAEAIDDAMKAGNNEPLLAAYPDMLKKSWIYKELKKVRNIRPGFHKGFWRGMISAAIDTYIFRGRAPWTLHHKPDHEQLQPKSAYRPIDYPKPDGQLTFDKLTSVQLTGTNHEEDQPCHLKLRDDSVPNNVNLAEYGGPEQYYCPAKVYEYVDDGNGGQKLQINAQNCIHCKTCDIKDPTQNIHWTVPEGGGGPRYPNM